MRKRAGVVWAGGVQAGVVCAGVVRALTRSAVILLIAICPVTAQRTEGTANVGEARLYYEAVGSGAPIIIVHGGPGLDHGYLQPGMDTLSDEYRLIYYDQRGTGRSTAPLTEASIHVDQFVDDIDALRTTLGYDRVTVLGHSLGAILALRYASRYSGRLDALILMNPPEPGTRFQEATAERVASRRDPENAAAIAELAGSEGFAERDPTTLGEIYRLLFRDTLRDPEQASELNLELAPMTARQGQDVAQLLGGSMQGYDGWAEIPSIRTPTLIVHGRFDLPPEAMSRALADAFPNGSLALLETGHFPYLESPDELRIALASFFDSVR